MARLRREAVSFCLPTVKPKGIRAIMTPKKITRLASSIITVGDGRGFVIEHEANRLIITAAHCLPFFPPCHGMSYTEERTYPALLGPLGNKPTVLAECLFADPIADIAVLGSPDNQVLFDEASAYEALTESVRPIIPWRGAYSGAR
jgi:hypothetical protein